MGMFDWYKPAKQFTCPICGTPLKNWQGKEGPCGLFVWQEGEKRPVDQLIDDDARLSVEERQQWVLPPRFHIYSCDCPHSIDALGTTQDGIWTSTNLRPYREYYTER